MTPQLQAQVRQFKRLDLAVVSFRECRALTEHVVDSGLKPSSGTAELYSACSCGIVTTYARPFLRSDGLGPLDALYSQTFASDDMLKTHFELIRYRHAVFAHRDLKKSQEFDLREGSYPVVNESIIVLKNSGAGKASLHTEPTLLYVHIDSLPFILELCVFQIERINRAATTLLENMAGNRVYPPGKYILGKTFP